jgi:hypothetical protein
MDIFSNMGNDKIVAAEALIDGKLEIMAGVGTYNNSTYEIIETTGAAGSLRGLFKEIEISDKGLRYELKYEGNKAKLAINGINREQIYENRRAGIQSRGDVEGI